MEGKICGAYSSEKHFDVHCSYFSYFMVQTSEQRPREGPQPAPLWAGHSLWSPQFCAPSTAPHWILVFPDWAEEAPHSVCHGESLGLLATYLLRLLVM